MKFQYEHESYRQRHSQEAELAFRRDVLNNPLLRDVSELGDDRVSLNDGGGVMLPDHIANIVEVLDVPLKTWISDTDRCKRRDKCTYQRLLTLGKGAERMRVHREARIHADESARLIVHLDVVVAGEEGNFSRHYGSCV